MLSEVTFRCDDGFEMPGRLALPDAGGPRPALLLVYELFGLTDEMVRIAEDLAAQGWVVLVPDLFARGRIKVLCVASAIRTVIRGQGRELGDLGAARSWLAAHPAVDGERIGAIGFCMGGGFALLLAGTGLYTVSAPFYGPTRELDRSCPVVASFGGRDRMTKDKPQKLAVNLDALGVPHDIKTYPDAGHAFYNLAPPRLERLFSRLPVADGYHQPSAEDARERVIAFFREHLDPAPPSPSETNS